jgi:hypothetical protein
MKNFSSARQAKEFLVSKIIEEAQREGVPLSEVERKMLYFSETGWTLPDMVEVNEQFDSEYGQAEYEKKIAKLIRGVTERAREESSEEYRSWRDAVRALRKEDHYLLVMVDQASRSVRPPGDRLKLWSTGFAVVGVIAGASLLAAKFNVDLDKYFPSRNTLSFVIWGTMAGLAMVYVVLWLLLGKQRMDKLFVKVIERVFKSSSREK